MRELKDKTTTMQSRTSKNCAKTGPATNTSVCQQMAIVVMLWGKAGNRSKISIFMIALRSEDDKKILFNPLFSVTLQKDY